MAQLIYRREIPIYALSQAINKFQSQIEILGYN